jgi:UDP-N-acetylglucosamine 1-carboxyvinyltransferase
MRFIIQGGKKIDGIIKLAGAKNAATKMMVASLLTDDPCFLENFPSIGDVSITAELCRQLGSKVTMENQVAELHTPRITNSRVFSLSRKNRIPILALGPLLARTGEAEIPILGGDKIGPRPVDIHLNALAALGAKIEVLPDRYIASAPNGLRGARVALRYPSVGATENTILAAVLAKGRTIIQNAAVEPEIIDLIKMLNKMGAIIEIDTHRNLTIEGVNHLRGITHRVLPDRNEAVSFACLAAASGGQIFVEDAQQEHLLTFLSAFRRAGGEYEVQDDGILFYSGGSLKAVNIETEPHPGFMTDWQQPFSVLMTQAEGTSTVHETVYEDRFGYATDLNLMGARITVLKECAGESVCRFQKTGFQHSAKISGSTLLRGSNLQVRDLRAGIAHVIAALIAEGESVLEGIEELDRGYEKIDERLRQIGADIKRI